MVDIVLPWRHQKGQAVRVSASAGPPLLHASVRGT